MALHVRRGRRSVPRPEVIFQSFPCSANLHPACFRDQTGMIQDMADAPSMSDDGTSRKKRGGSRSRWLSYVSWGVSAAALAYVLSRLQLSQLGKDLSGITWWLVAVAILVEIMPRLLEAWRWQYLLRPLRVRFDGLLQAIYVGTLDSAVLPLSGGGGARRHRGPAGPRQRHPSAGDRAHRARRRCPRHHPGGVVRTSGACHPERATDRSSRPRSGP